ELLQHEAVIEAVEAGAAVLGRHFGVHQPQLERLGAELRGELVLAIELSRNRDDPVLGELARGLNELLLLRGQIKHLYTSTANRQPDPRPPPELPDCLTAENSQVFAGAAFSLAGFFAFASGFFAAATLAAAWRRFAWRRRRWRFFMIVRLCLLLVIA